MFSGQVKNNALYIGDDRILETSGLDGVSDREVYVGIRPEGFVLNDNGPLCCNLSGVEVMGRDISVVSTNEHSVSPTIRSIISSDSKIDASADTVRFAVKPNKVYIFDKETENRIRFKTTASAEE